MTTTTTTTDVPAQNRTCSICVETFNKKTHRPIECFHCHALMCKECVERYLLQTTQNAHCMHCRTEWSRMFLGSVMTQSFLNKAYKRFRETMIFEREQSLFPQTMPILEVDRELDELQARSLELHQQITALKTMEARNQQRLRQTRTRRHGMINQLFNGGGAAPVVVVANTDTSEETEEEEAVHYRRPCVQTDCPGFIQSRTGFCNSCQRITCVKCNVACPPRDTNDNDDENHGHTCNPDDVAIWLEIKKTTKPCPGCGTRIFKTGGCQQMWCSQCHTAFNWVTGQIERGPVHNPHYYEWMFGDRTGRPGGAPPVLRRRGNDVDDDNDCVEGAPARRIEAFVFQTTLLQRQSLPPPPDTPPSNITTDMMLKHHRAVVHLENVTLVRDRLILEPRHIHHETLHIRLKYLKHEITQDQFKVLLQRSEKKIQKKTEHYRILETYTILYREILDRFVRDRHMTIPTLVQHIEHIQHITNSGIDNINSCYHCDLRHITWTYSP